MTKGIKKCQEIIFMNKKNKTRLTKSTSIQAKHFIERYCNQLDIDEEFTENIMNICNISIDKNLITENTPQSVAAGCIFYFIKNDGKHKINISKKDNVSELLNKLYVKRIMLS